MAFAKKPAKKKRTALPSGKKNLSEFRKLFADKIVDITAYDKVEVIPTGSIILDQVTGIGGYPRGRITELWGEEGVSKTTLALQAVAECQKLGMAAAYFDFEGAFSNQYARDLGVNISDRDKFLYFEPTSFEDAEAALQEIPQVDNVGLVVIDSISAMTPESHYEGGGTIGLLARKLSQFLSVFVKVLRKNMAAC
ncbi:MAG: AAA family ATPase, partial [Dehalococcoidia bacterium]|nr:AAA family ATPase [Dehalococcoidia bacterium]